MKETPPLFGCEDFGELATLIDRPYSFFVFGGTDPKLWDGAVRAGTVQEALPTNHSPFFAPVIQPILKTVAKG
jgi:hypothetical protein